MKMEELQIELLSTIIQIIVTAKKENISADEYETMIIDTLNAAGVECSR